jgi:hypothetical protein
MEKRSLSIDSRFTAEEMVRSCRVRLPLFTVAVGTHTHTKMTWFTFIFKRDLIGVTNVSHPSIISSLCIMTDEYLTHTRGINEGMSIHEVRAVKRSKRCLQTMMMMITHFVRHLHERVQDPASNRSDTRAMDAAKYDALLHTRIGDLGPWQLAIVLACGLLPLGEALVTHMFTYVGFVSKFRCDMLWP